MAQQLLDQRTEAKREMKLHPEGSTEYELLDAKQQALKVLCNSLYGALNAILKNTLYCRPLGAIVTAEGRRAISMIEETIKAHPDARQIAGDTDSLMFLLPNHSIERAEEVGKAIAQTITDRLRSDGAHAMTLAYEKTMLPSVFVAKKAYAYMCYTPGCEKPSHKSMGLLSKKRGSVPIIRQAFIDCESAYLLDKPAYLAAAVRFVPSRDGVQS